LDYRLQNIVSIDYRPATGQLYALGLLAEFILLEKSGVATAVGSTVFSPLFLG
jgi:hypothetical protein